MRLLKSAALTALENASHLPTDTKQPLLLLCHHSFETNQSGFGDGCSLLRMNPRPPSNPCLCHLQPHFPGSGAARLLASCMPRSCYTTNSWPWLMHGAAVGWQLRQGDLPGLEVSQALPAKLGSKPQPQHMLSIKQHLATGRAGRGSCCLHLYSVVPALPPSASCNAPKDYTLSCLHFSIFQSVKKFR